MGVTPKNESKRKKPARITGRTSAGGHLRIVRANVKLLKHLGRVRDREGSRWWTAESLDFFKRPVRHELSLIHTCWACGLVHEHDAMTRAHVVACRHGGDDEAGNYFLLCDYCHEEQPDAAIRRVQVEWLECREYFWDRIVRKTTRFVSELEAVLVTTTKERADEFLLRAARTALWGLMSERAGEMTGSLVKQSRMADEFSLEAARRWCRGEPVPELEK